MGDKVEIQNKMTVRRAIEYQRMVSVAESMELGSPVIDWYQVALKLAKNHIPELKENKPQGPKVKWGKFEKMMLAGEIYRLKIDGCTIEQACEELAKMDVWKKFLEKKTRYIRLRCKSGFIKTV